MIPSSTSVRSPIVLSASFRTQKSLATSSGAFHPEPPRTLEVSNSIPRSRCAKKPMVHSL